MPGKTRDEFDPYGILDDRGMSLTERLDYERGRAWAYYINGGGGDPSYFDGYTWTRMQERQRDR